VRFEGPTVQDNRAFRYARTQATFTVRLYIIAHLHTNDSSDSLYLTIPNEMNIHELTKQTSREVNQRWPRKITGLELDRINCRMRISDSQGRKLPAAGTTAAGGPETYGGGPAALFEPLKKPNNS